MRTLVSVVGSVLLLAGGTYAVGDWLGVWDPIVVASSAQSQFEEAGWTTHRGPGFSIALPDSWVPTKVRKQAVAAAFRSNPKWAKFARDTNKAVRGAFIAVDMSREARDRAAREHFATNLLIGKVRVSGSAREVWKRELKSLASLPGRVGPVRHARVVIGGWPTLKIESRFRFRLPHGARAVLSDAVWVVVTGGYEYVITYTTTKRDRPLYAETFEKSATSFVVLHKKKKAVSVSTAASKPFRRLADDTCITYAPEYVPGATAARARATAREFAVLERKLARIHPPRGLRSDYRAMLASLNDVVAAEQRKAKDLAEGDDFGAYSASHDAIDATQRARSYARRLHLPWCAQAVVAAT